jgi:hypothetical protein
VFRPSWLRSIPPPSFWSELEADFRAPAHREVYLTSGGAGISERIPVCWPLHVRNKYAFPNRQSVKFMPAVHPCRCHSTRLPRIGADEQALHRAKPFTVDLHYSCKNCLSLPLGRNSVRFDHVLCVISMSSLRFPIHADAYDMPWSLLAIIRNRSPGESRPRPQSRSPEPAATITSAPRLSVRASSIASVRNDQASCIDGCRARSDTPTSIGGKGWIWRL